LRQETVAADVALARQRLIAANNLRLGGIALDQGFSAERFEGWIALIDALHLTKLSCENVGPPPTLQQLRVFSVIAIKCLLQNVPLIAREFESVPPASRTTFAKISSGWADAATRSAKQYLESVGAAIEVESADAAPVLEPAE
jgi:hypothetical protein